MGKISIWVLLQKFEQWTKSQEDSEINWEGGTVKKKNDMYFSSRQNFCMEVTFKEKTETKQDQTNKKNLSESYVP